MIDLEAIENGLYIAWSDYLKTKLGSAPQMLLSNQDIPKGKLEFPRVVYNISTPYGTNARTVKSTEVVPSEDPNFEEDVMYHYLLAPRITISINAYSRSGGNARKIAMQLREWFEIEPLGNRFFDENYDGAIKQNTLTEINDRTTFLETDYQQRFGFDIQVELEDEILVREDTIETIELTQNGTTENIDM